MEYTGIENLAQGESDRIGEEVRAEYARLKGDQPKAELTPAERQIADALVDPDDTSHLRQGNAPKLTPDASLQIVAACLRDADFLGWASQELTPSHFDGVLQTAFSVASSYHKRYNACPSWFVIQQEVYRLFGLTKDAADCKKLVAEIQCAVEGYNASDGQYLKDQVALLKRQAALTQHCHSIFEASKKGDIDRAWKLAATPPAASVASEDCRLCTLDELLSQKTTMNWIIPKRLPLGKLHLAHGLSKEGKTTCLYQAAIDIVYDRKAFGQDCPDVFILVLDFENPTDYFSEFILGPALAGRDLSELKNRMAVSNRETTAPGMKLPPAVTPAYLSQLFKFYQDKGPLWVVIDSLRRAFGRATLDGKPLPEKWENDADVMNRLLDPIAELCHTSGNTVTIVHHDNKGGSMSGSGDIMAVADVIWHFKRKRDQYGKKTTGAKVEMEGRGVPEHPLHLRMSEGKYVYLGEGDTYELEAETKAQVSMMFTLGTMLEKEPQSGASLVAATGVTDKNVVYDALKVMGNRSMVEYKGKKYHVTSNWRNLHGAFRLEQNVVG